MFRKYQKKKKKPFTGDDGYQSFLGFAPMLKSLIG